MHDGARDDIPAFGGGVAAVVEDGLATLALASPRLTAEAAEALARAVDWACGQAVVQAVLIGGARAAFCIGAGMPPPEEQSPVPAISRAFRQIELAEKPVIAVLYGHVAGEGLELALAAHYRIALASAQVSLPQVTWGLLPGAGGTQRLPRLIGAAPALELMVRGKSIGADAAADLGLVDQVVVSGLGESARQFAFGLVAEGLGPRPTLDRRDQLDHAAAFLQEIADRGAMRGMTTGARGHIVNCVEAALILPPEAGLGFEAVRFADCIESDTSRALCAFVLSE